MTLRTLRRALEDAETKDEPVVIKGPLSDEFTKSLNEVYAKKPEEGDQVSTESQANDAIAMQQLAKAIANEINPEVDHQPPTVFAVSAPEVTAEDVVALTTDMINQEPGTYDDYALVLDTTTPEMLSGGGDGYDGTVTKYVDLSPDSLAAAMESIAKAHGVKVYPSLEAYAIDRYIR